MTFNWGGWDTHSDNFKTLRRQLPRLDSGLSSLLQDLSDRGLDKDVTIVMWGEFGRTPRVNSGAGRDHWSRVTSCFLAGGGLKTGQMIGTTSRNAEEAKERRFTCNRFLPRSITVWASPSTTPNCSIRTVGRNTSSTAVNRFANWFEIVAVTLRRDVARTAERAGHCSGARNGHAHSSGASSAHFPVASASRLNATVSPFSGCNGYDGCNGPKKSIVPERTFCTNNTKVGNAPTGRHCAIART